MKSVARSEKNKNAYESVNLRETDHMGDLPGDGSIILN
jgi:hypothetical protein